MCRGKRREEMVGVSTLFSFYAGPKRGREAGGERRGRKVALLSSVEVVEKTKLHFFRSCSDVRRITSLVIATVLEMNVF